MLHDDTEVALNGVMAELKKSAGLTGSLGEFADRRPVSDVLDELQRTWERNAVRLKEEIRAAGWLPAEPDPDRETVETALLRIRTALGEDRDRMLLEKVEELRISLAKAVEEALSEDLPSPLRDALRGLQRDAEEAGKRLREAGEARC